MIEVLGALKPSGPMAPLSTSTTSDRTTRPATGYQTGRQSGLASILVFRDLMPRGFSCRAHTQLQTAELISNVSSFDQYQDQLPANLDAA
jgi:hypothetical protein